MILYRVMFDVDSLSLSNAPAMPELPDVELYLHALRTASPGGRAARENDHERLGFEQGFLFFRRALPGTLFAT